MQEKINQLNFLSHNEKNEKFDSRINLYFFRHGEKQDKYDDNKDMAITDKSRKEIMAMPMDVDQPDKTIHQVAFGNQALRTKETAGLIMGRGDQDITGDEALEELKIKLDKNLNIGTKLGYEKLLDFAFNKNSPVDKKLLEATKNGEWIKFIINESDDLTKDLKDKEAITYTRISAKISKLIVKYVKIEKKWNDIVKKRGCNPTMERYFGSPAAIAAFLAKIVEKTSGKKERDEFADSLKEGHFDYLDGFNIEIMNNTDGDSTSPIIIINYNGEYKFNTIISKEMLEEIIEEGKKFEQELLRD